MSGEGPGPRGLREGRALFVAGIITTLGDALAGVGAGFLVNDRTGSASLTALTMAASFLPGLVGGLGLSGLADRYPRREVAIVCLLLCVPIVLCIDIPHLPAVAVIALVAMVELVSQPLNAARTALVAQVVPEERLAKFIGLDRTAHQLCLFLGVIAGAAAVGLFGATTALALDAGSFALSALLIVLLVRSRPAENREVKVKLVGGGRDGWRSIREEPVATRAVVVAWCAVAGGVVLEGLAIPVARDFSGAGAESTETTTIVVLLLGSLLGTAVVGAFVGSWLSRQRQRVLLVPLALLATLPSIAFASRPPELVAIGLYALAGLSAVSSIFGQILFSTTIRQEVFARAMGVASGGVSFAQGLALVGSAALAQFLNVQDVIAISTGVVGIFLIVASVSTRLPRSITLPDVTSSGSDQVSGAAPQQGQRV